MALAPKPIAPIANVEPAIEIQESDNRPNDIRYGWCPFQNIRLTAPDGTMALYVQPHLMELPDGTLALNPYARELPKCQLIPFRTFQAIQMVLSEDKKDSKGSAMPVQTQRTSTAYENILQVMRGYSGWGFVTLHALQGIDQDQARRIFQIVQPFEYPLSQIEAELEFGALARIEATEPIVFEDYDGYTIENLRNDFERAKARQLAAEMLSGATRAVAFANTTLDESIVSITTRYSGGIGKPGPDGLDLYLAEQLDRRGDLPNITGKPTPATVDPRVNEKLDVLISDMENRQLKEKNAALEEELNQLRALKAANQATPEGSEPVTGISPAPEPTAPPTNGNKPAPTTKTNCGYVKTDGTACKRQTPEGEFCAEHAAIAEQEAAALAALDAEE